MAGCGSLAEEKKSTQNPLARLETPTLAHFLECYAKPAIPDFEAAWRRVDAPRGPAAGSAQLCPLPSVAVPSFARKRAPQPVVRRASDHGRLDCVAGSSQLLLVSR